MVMRATRLVCFLAFLTLVGSAQQSQPPGPGKGLNNPGPLTPARERATFKLPDGFRIDLAASEPGIVDPVALAFDERGRLFVAEMYGYPNEGIGTGDINNGKVKCLEDRDGDGLYETATVFAEGLRFPMGLLPWRDGLIVAVAPDLLYFEDKNHDGKADVKRVLYTGFGLDNIQQLLNTPTFGLDNWVYVCNGASGGKIRCPEKADWPALELRARGVRLHPDVPGSLEPTSGGGQYGIVQDSRGRWLTNTNSQHLRQIVLPDDALARNPSLPVKTTTIDIPEHGAACKVFRISPFEAWRVERTSRRKEGPGSARFSKTELVPGGFITSACSPIVLQTPAFPPEYQGNVLVCDPANNLLHYDILHPNGVVLKASRGLADREFLASTDNWFRPVATTIGPDGALYIADFYREVIETPRSLPADIKAAVNLQSRARGRIWRVTASDVKPAAPRLDRASTADLVALLDSPNVWQRRTAQRLLFERQDQAARPALEKLIRESKSAAGRIHALWALDGLGAVNEAVLRAALADADEGVRENAVQVAAKVSKPSAELTAALLKRAEDRAGPVRFALALALKPSAAPEVSAALATILRHDVADTWVRTAVLSAAPNSAGALLGSLLADDAFRVRRDAGALGLMQQLAALVGTRGDERDLQTLLTALAKPAPGAWQFAVLEGLAQGLRLGSRPATFWDSPPANLAPAVAEARKMFDTAAVRARDEKGAPAGRLDAVRLLGRGPFAPLAAIVPDLLEPRQSADLQQETLRALGQHTAREVAGLVLAGWSAYSPAVRREAVEVLLARPERVAALLDALERKQVAPLQLEPARLDQLRKHPNAALRSRAVKLLAGLVPPDRQKVLDRYKAALDLKPDDVRGAAVFKQHCAACHTLDGQGKQVGPDLLAALPNKTPQQLLLDLLDPSREVDPRYLAYLATTTQGQTLTGLIAAETATSVTLRRAEGVEDVLLRTKVDQIQATTKSLMPEGLEQQLKPQDVADVIAYLLRKRK